MSALRQIILPTIGVRETYTVTSVQDLGKCIHIKMERDKTQESLLLGSGKRNLPDSLDHFIPKPGSQ